MSTTLPIANAPWLPAGARYPAHAPYFVGDATGFPGRLLHGLRRWLGSQMARRLAAYEPDCRLL